MKLVFRYEGHFKSGLCFYVGGGGMGRIQEESSPFVVWAKIKRITGYKVPMEQVLRIAYETDT
jgi:hypothetical protein